MRYRSSSTAVALSQSSALTINRIGKAIGVYIADIYSPSIVQKIPALSKIDFAISALTALSYVLSTTSISFVVFITLRVLGFPKVNTFFLNFSYIKAEFFRKIIVIFVT